MTSGFAHFDGAHRENFAAGLILLCIDASTEFKRAFGELVRRKAKLPETGQLVACGREELLGGLEEKKRRSDIWLRYNDGVLLVELKTHSHWDLNGVIAQMADQTKSSFGNETVLGAVLLAPGFLLRQLASTSFPKLSWHDVLDGVDAIECPGEIVQFARKHWSECVEKDFGLPAGTEMLGLAANAAQTGCLVAFLRAAFYRLDGKVDGNTVWFSSPDGRPKRLGDWAWVATAVRGALPGYGDSYIGIYTYSTVPAGFTEGTFLEAYKTGQDDEPIASIPFNPKDLSPETLNSILEEFVSAYSACVGVVKS